MPPNSELPNTVVPETAPPKDARRGPGAIVNAGTIAAALLIGAVLQFAALAKAVLGLKDIEAMQASRVAEQAGLPPSFDPQGVAFLLAPGTVFENGLLLDIAIAVAEFVIALLVALAWRWRGTWLLVPVLFGGLAGFALSRTIGDQPCGCFGALWEPPRGFSLVMDVLFVALGLTLAALRGAPKALVAGSLIAAVAASGIGYGYSESTMPPTPEDIRGEPGGLTAAERLLAIPDMQDIAAADPDFDPAWYVFLHDPTCSTCAAMKPVIDQDKLVFEAEGNPFLQVRMFEKGVLANQHGIESHAWETSPAVLVVRGGKVVQQYGGDSTPFPHEVAAALESGSPLSGLGG